MERQSILPKLESMQCYPESLWTKVGKRVSQSLDIEETTFYEGTGTSFIDFGKIRNLVICRNFIKPEKNCVFSLPSFSHPFEL